MSDIAMRACAVLISAFLLVACGPGTGGTGTGPSVSIGSPAMAQISFSTGSATERSASVFGPTNSLATTTALTLDADRIDLRQNCQGFVYVGSWSLLADGTVSLLGTYTALRKNADGSSEYITLIATLGLQFASGKVDSDTATAVVKDRSNTVLMGPFSLQKNSPSSPSVTVCSGAS